MKEVTLQALSDVGGALAHPGRLRILALLREGPIFVCQVRAVLGMAPSTVSAHLGILRRSGLVNEEKQGRFVQYGLTLEEPLGSVAREVLYLVKDDRKVLQDARLLQAVRRIAPASLCREGFDRTAVRVEGEGCRRAASTQARIPRR